MELGEGVGLPHQETTPLLVGHTDIVDERGAQSYAAEAARCMLQVERE